MSFNAKNSKIILSIARDVVSRVGKNFKGADNIDGFSSKDNILPLFKSGIDWTIFKNSLAYHELTPFAYFALKEYFSLLPRDLIKLLELSYHHYINYNCYLEEEFLLLHQFFKDKNIVLVPIKGMALLNDLYAEYPLRPSVDVDVLIKKKDLDAAIMLLGELGFKKELEGLSESYWREKYYHFVFSKETSGGFSFTLELHWGLDYPGKKIILSQIFSRLRKSTVRNKQIELLSPEDTFLALALHQRRFGGKVLILKNVCDMALLLNKYALDFDWNYVLAESRISQIRSVVFFALYQVNFLLEMNLPDNISKELSLPVWRKSAIRNFIRRNTFLMNQDSQVKELYLKEHFLLYDNFRGPADYIFNIPQEQFAKFYCLKPYAGRTKFFYKIRLLYIPCKALLSFLKNMRKIIIDKKPGVTQKDLIFFQEHDAVSVDYHSIIELPNEVSDILISRNKVVFRVVGSCMFPVILAGDSLRIEPVKPKDAMIGDIILYRSAERFYVHRLIKKYEKQGELYILTSGEKEYRNNRLGGIGGIEVSSTNILGKVTAVKRGSSWFSPIDARLGLGDLIRHGLKSLVWKLMNKVK